MLKLVIVLLCTFALCLGCNAASGSERLRYSQGVVGQNAVGVDDITPFFCIQSLQFDGDFWLYNLCSCNITAQFMITYDYYFSEALQIQTNLLQAWNGAPGGRYPNNALLFSKDYEDDKQATLLSVIPQSGTSCNAPAAFCVDVEMAWDNVAEGYGFLLFNRCSFPVQVLYICDSFETSLLKSYSVNLQNWNGRSSPIGGLPNNAAWSACSENNFDDGVIVLSSKTAQ